MLGRVVAELGRAFDEVVVVAGTAVADPASELSQPFVRIMRDSEAFEGPVKALRLGLVTVRADVAFACACDLPFVNAALAATLCAMAERRDAAMPMVHGRLQVLHAAYRKSCLPALDAMIARGARRLQDLAPALDARIVSEAEVLRLRSGFAELLQCEHSRRFRACRTVDKGTIAARHSRATSRAFMTPGRRRAGLVAASQAEGAMVFARRMPAPLQGPGAATSGNHEEVSSCA